MDGGTSRIKPAIIVAVDQFVTVGPAHGFFCPCGDIFAIGEFGQVGCSAQVIPFIDSIIVEHLREFLPADGFPWAEGIVLISCSVKKQWRL